MKILPELAHAYDTKKRSPFKIVVETVKLSELREAEDNKLLCIDT